MFEKLLSNLPYNPSLVHQLRFYGKRMHREAAIRRTGLVFIVLSFFVQFFAVVAPPQPTVAYSTNDMINGGVEGSGISDAQSKAKIVKACRDNTKSYGTVLADFGISCDRVASTKSSVVSVSSTDYNKQLYSMGWISYGATNKTSGKPTDQQVLRPYGVPAADQPLYARYLWSFDTGSHSDYKALRVTANDGKTYFILFSCGNLVAIHPPVLIPHDYCPDKTGIQSSVSECDVCSNLPGVQTSASQCDVCSNIAGVQTSTSQCDVCTNVSGVQKTSSQCDVCPNLAGVQTKSSQCDVCSNVTGVQTTVDQCDVCSNIPGVQSASSQCTPPTTSNPCPYDSSIAADSTQCKPCDKSVSSDNLLACISLSKEAADETHAFADPDNPNAQAGDVIKYSLHVNNSGKTTFPQFTMQENLSDVLDYATVKDLDGGTIDANNLVTWGPQDIAASGTETHTITVQVKDPIPNTPPDPGDPGHFDHIMTNTYGNTVDISLPGSVVTTVVASSSKLVNTGPGSSLIAAGAIVVVAGYFFARARLLAEESVIAVRQTANHGGM